MASNTSAVLDVVTETKEISSVVKDTNDPSSIYSGSCENSLVTLYVFINLYLNIVLLGPITEFRELFYNTRC